MIIAEEHCGLTSTGEDVKNLSAFVTQTMQCLSERRGEKSIGDDSVNLEDIWCANIGVGGDFRHKMRSVCPNMTLGNDNETIDPSGEIVQILRVELGILKFTSTPIKATRPIYTRKRSSVLSKQDKPPCKAVPFDVASGSKTGGGAGLPSGNVTDASEGVPEGFVTSDGLSKLEGIAQRQGNERVVGARTGIGGDSMVRVPPADERLVWARRHTGGEDEILSQSGREKFVEGLF